MGSSASRVHPPFRKFQCPYERDGTELIREHLELVSDDDCPFGHSKPRLSISIPKFVCTQYLYGQCHKQRTEMQLPHDGCNRVVVCEDGRLHSPLDDQLKRHLEDLTRAIADGFWLGRSLSPMQEPQVKVQEPEIEYCPICLDTLAASSPGQFGLLRDCPHVCCAACLVDWSQSRNVKSCPVCRLEYKGIVVWHRVITSEQEKAELYQLQNSVQEVPRTRDQVERIVIQFRNEEAIEMLPPMATPQ